MGRRRSRGGIGFCGNVYFCLAVRDSGMLTAYRGAPESFFKDVRVFRFPIAIILYPGQMSGGGGSYARHVEDVS